MIGIEKHFVYLSQLLGRRVYQCDKKQIGKVADLVILSKGIYHEVVGIIVTKCWSSTSWFIPWDKVADFEADIVLLPPPNQTFQSYVEQNGTLLLKQTFLDKQIVDISGCKVVRVNDLHLLKESGKLWTAHVDVGFRGLLRRLGWEESMTKILRWLFSYQLHDRFITWKYVQAVAPSTDFHTGGPIKLTVSHDKLIELHPADLAEILEGLGRRERIAIFRTLDAQTSAEVLEELKPKLRHTLFDSIPGEKASAIIMAMPTDEAADLMLTISKKRRDEILKLIQKEKADEINKLLIHPEETAGSLMKTEFCKFLPTASMDEVMTHIRQRAGSTETIYYIYVINEQDVLMGVTTLRRILATEPTKKLSEIMHAQPIRVRTTTNRQRVIKIFTKYNFGSIPVVDSHNKLVGVITAKDALEGVMRVV